MERGNSDEVPFERTCDEEKQSEVGWTGIVERRRGYVEGVEFVRVSRGGEIDEDGTS